MINTIERIRVIESPEDIMYRKLMTREEITREDVKALELFNDYWIDEVLFKAGQQVVRDKMLEVMTREAMVVF